MRDMPSALKAQFLEYLGHKAVPNNAHASCLKWLHYYLDFCEKYNFPNAQTRSPGHFLHKLEEKMQTPAQQDQARHAIALYYELVQPGESSGLACSPQKGISPGNASGGSSPLTDSPFKEDPGLIEVTTPTQAPAQSPSRPISTPRTASPAKGVSWKAEYASLSGEIKLRHYSPKTLRAYRQWVRHYQTFTRSQDPQTLSTRDVKEFLTHLAVNQKVSASTQNQAFNALLFFHRHVLKKEFGKVEGVVRAKRKL